MQVSDVTRRIQPKRKIEGMSAVLLPFDARGNIDLDGLAHNLERTLNAGITPAVNMDTGYTNLITAEERTRVLGRVREVVAGRPFVAGAFVETEEGEMLSRYQKAVAEIQEHGGTPILFQCSDLKAKSSAEKVALYKAVAKESPKFLAFELGEMFAPFGDIYDLDTMRELMHIPELVGSKHSSLSRELEWQRLELRDEVRPDFKIYTGNDLAVDLVMYGSDYLLGLSAFSPEAFALRDKLWEIGDAGFYALNDLIQYLGFLAFRPPVPAYKHNAAQFLTLRGRIESNTPHPKAVSRPESDIEILRDISERLDAMMEELA
ncbi:MAG TPA: dihydrodipicolinate synthase family protein, partial [Abditibacteriaceae bacterium]